MATTQDIVKTMTSEMHKRYLKPLGFRKSGNTWIRSREWPQVLNIQLSQYNSSAEAQFTVNLGISINELHNASGGLPIKRSLKEYDCDVRTRIGRLMPNRYDKWWQVNVNTDSCNLADKVFARIEQFGLPWFDRLIDYPTVAAEFLERGIPFLAAIAYQLEGDKESAQITMKQAVDKSNRNFLPKLKRIASNLDIPIAG